MILKVLNREKEKIFLERGREIESSLLLELPLQIGSLLVQCTSCRRHYTALRRGSCNVMIISQGAQGPFLLLSSFPGTVIVLSFDARAPPPLSDYSSPKEANIFFFFFFYLLLSSSSRRLILFISLLRHFTPSRMCTKLNFTGETRESRKSCVFVRVRSFDSTLFSNTTILFATKSLLFFLYLFSRTFCFVSVKITSLFR